MNAKLYSGFIRNLFRRAARVCLLVSLFVGVLEISCRANISLYRPENGICGGAVDGDLEKVIAYLQADPTAITNRDAGRTSLHWAAASGKTNVVVFLLKRGADPNLGDNEEWATGSTPLHSAAFSGHAGVVKCLLDHGADVNAVAKGGYSVLWSACSGWPKKEIIELVVKSGADPNVKADNGVTPLQELAFREPPDVLKLLVDAGADVNQPGWEGTTAIHWAMDGNNVAAALYLAEQGADGNSKTKDGISALARARVKAALGENYSMRPKWRQVAKTLAKNSKQEGNASVSSLKSAKPTFRFDRRHQQK